MSKKLPTTKKIVDILNKEKALEYHYMSSEDMKDFVTYVQVSKEQNPNIVISLVDYVAEEFYSNQQNIRVIPDLSWVSIGTKLDLIRQNHIGTDDIDNLYGQYVNLSRVDFTGSNMRGVSFQSCNLKNAIFCDLNLVDVSFDDCYMPGVDMRGAGLSSCNITESSICNMLTDNSSMRLEELSELQNYKNKKSYEGIVFSSSAFLMLQYNIRNEEIRNLAEAQFDIRKAEKLEDKDQDIARKQAVINEVIKTVSYVETIFGGHEEYDRLYSEISNLNLERQSIKDFSFEESFDNKDIQYVMNPSVASLPSRIGDVNLLSFDPVYKKGSCIGLQT